MRTNEIYKTHLYLSARHQQQKYTPEQMSQPSIATLLYAYHQFPTLIIMEQNIGKHHANESANENSKVVPRL